MEIVILEGSAVNPGDLSWDALRAFGTLTVYDNTPQSEMAARIKNADAVLLNKLNFTAELMDAAPRLRYIGELATGYNNIDVAAAHARGITVCNIPAYSTASVVQHTFALLFELCVHAGEHSRGVMLGIPTELFTPIFAMARIVGWSAHRIDELINVDKIIRPAYREIVEHRDYIPFEDR